nr:MAG TPA: hypothetical protein [Caudoviricetes sp.]
MPDISHLRCFYSTVVVLYHFLRQTLKCPFF